MHGNHKLFIKTVEYSANAVSVLSDYNNVSLQFDKTGKQDDTSRMQVKHFSVNNPRIGQKISISADIVFGKD